MKKINKKTEKSNIKDRDWHHNGLTILFKKIHNIKNYFYTKINMLTQV